MCKKIVFSNEWFNGAHYIKKSGGHYAFTVYGLLQYITPYDGRVIISLDGIRECLGMNKTTRDNTKNLKDALKFLIENSMIRLYKSYHSEEVIDCDFDNLKCKTFLFLEVVNMPDNRMTLIDYNEFTSIVIKGSLSISQRMAMLCYFSAIISHINSVTKVAFPKIKLLKEEAYIGRESTCISFNNSLSDMGILIFGNAGVKSRGQGSTTGESDGYVSNTYARPQHEAQLQERLKNMQETHRANHISSEKRKIGNRKRGLSTQIRWAKMALKEFVDNDEMDKAELKRVEIKALEAEYNILKEKTS